MKYRPFGATDLVVSEVGFGCARLGGFLGELSRSDLLRTLHRALDAGITFFDTADMYCQGESESLIGEAFHRQRQQVIIASKVGYCIPTQRKLLAHLKPLLRPLARRLGLRRERLPASVRGTLTQDFSPAYIVQAVEQSLRRLRTDYLDLYQLHGPPSSVLESGEALLTLEKLQRQGKIRYYGVSCERTEDTNLCLEHDGIAALQVRLSLLDQSALDGAVPHAAVRCVAIIARECYAGGLLARPSTIMEQSAELDAVAGPHDRLTREVGTFNDIARKNGRTLAETAIQFVLGIEGVCVALIGMRTIAHLDGNLANLDGRSIEDAELKALRAVHV